MKGKNVVMLGVSCILLMILYSLIAFMFPFNRGESFWIGYAFGIGSVCISYLIWLYTTRGSRNNRFLGFPILFYTVCYVIIQLIIGIVFMAVDAVPMSISLILSLVLLFFIITLFLFNMMTRDYINGFEKDKKTEKLFIKSLKMTIAELTTINTSSEIAVRLRELSDAIQYSDPISDDRLYDLEETIEDEVGLLSSAIEDNNIDESINKIEKILQLLKQRNEKLKLLK